MTVIQRRTDWRPRLIAYVGGLRGARLDPGRHDCALFVAGAIDAMADVDLARSWRGYTTFEEGLNALSAAGYDGLRGLADANLPRVAAARAQVGDVALLREEGQDALGIVQGTWVWCVGRERLGLLPRRRMLAAWSV